MEEKNRKMKKNTKQEDSKKESKKIVKSTTKKATKTVKQDSSTAKEKKRVSKSVKSDTQKESVENKKVESVVKLVEEAKPSDNASTVNASDSQLNASVATAKQREKTSKNVFHVSEVVFLVVVTALVGILVGAACCFAFVTKSSSISNLPEELHEFIDHYNYIVDNYYEDVDKEKLIDSAIAGMLESLDDPYSSYMDESASDDFDLNLMGTYEGLGIEVYNDKENNIIVSRVFENTPASRVGIQPGDILISLNGKSMVGKSTAEFSDAVKKGKKETYQFEVNRNGEIIPYELKREVVIIPSVYAKTYTHNQKKVGYLQVTIFSATTYNQFKTKLEALEKEGIDALVIDLRDNSGGHLNVVADMISLFLDKKNVIYQIQSKSDIKKYYSTGKQTKRYPIAVLQNRNSASASELMSSALKEQYGASVVGTVSYGKGTVQELKDLSDGTQYKFTTKKWLTPKGEWINKKGVTPTISVELDETYFEDRDPAKDNQLQSALAEVTR